MTATIAGGVLCAEVDGVLWDTEAGEVVAASRALEWTRDQVRSIEFRTRVLRRRQLLHRLCTVRATTTRLIKRER